MPSTEYAQNQAPESGERTTSVRTRTVRPPRSAWRPVPTVTVVAVGLDAATEAAVLRAVGREDAYLVQRHDDLASARAALDEAGRAAIVVIDASALHKRVMFPTFVHVIAVAGPDRSEPRAFGVDEVVRRPLSVDDLSTRLRLASRALARDANETPDRALREALEGKRAGELIVSSADQTGRVHVEGGRVVWVHRPGRGTSLRGVLGDVGASLSDEAVRDIVDESRRKGCHFADVVVAWGLASHEDVRERLRAYVSLELRTVLEWSDATSTFVEDGRATRSTFSFSASEVLGGARRVPRSATVQGAAPVLPVQADPARVQGWLDRMAAVPNVLGCALLDTRVGCVLGGRGTLTEETDALWDMAGAFSSMGPGGDELFATGASVAYLVRSAAPEVPAVAVVVFDPNVLSPAMARILVTKAR